MKAFIRHILRSADSSKGQVAIIVITIAIVTAMVFLTFSMYDVFFNLNIAEYDRVADGADMLLGNNFGSDQLFSKARFDRVINAEPEGEITEVMYFTKFSTIFKTDTQSRTIIIEATDLADYLEKKPLRYVDIFTEQTEGADVPYYEAGGYGAVIIGENFAKETGVKVGDLVEVYLPTYEMYTTLLVRCIAPNEGIFGSASDRNILVDFESIGNQGQVNAVYISFSDEALFDKYEQLFATYFPAVECGEGNSYSDIISIVRNNTLLLSVGLLFLVATLMLILFTSYLIISRSRMSEMVIFKSAGATPKQVAGIMLGEVLFYAVVGGAIGLLLGRVLMGVAVKVLLPMSPNAVTYPFWKFVVSYIIAIAVSVLATLVPIVSVSKKTVRELTGEGFKVIKPVNIRLFIAVTILVIGIAVAYAFLKGIALLILSVALIIAVAFWIYCAIYFIVAFVGKLVRKTSKGGTPYLAGVSVTRNSAMHTVTTLIAVVIAFSFLIVEVVGIVQDAVIPFRERFEADYIISANSELKREEYDVIKGASLSVSGVEGVGWYNTTDFELEGGRDCTFYGVDSLWMMERCSTVTKEEIEKAWNSVERPLVLNQNITTIYGLEVGDTITLKPLEQDFKDETMTFTIIAIDRSVTRWDMIGFCKFEDLYRMNKYGTFFVKEKAGLTEQEQQEVFVDLRDNIEELGISLTYALDYAEWAYAETDGYEGVGTLLTMLQILVWFVSLMGVANISIVTVYDRRAEYRLYKVSGMSSGEYVKFSVFEGLIVGLAGGLLGLVAGYGVNMLVPSLATIIGRYSAFNVLPWQLFLNFAIGVGAFMLLWTLIALVNRKNTVKSINERNILN